MNSRSIRQLRSFTAAWLAVWCLASASLAQTAAFTYQGKLTDAGNPANGPYDLQFRLFDALVSGNQVGATAVREDVQATNGIFTVTLDFGAAAFPGAPRFLEIAVRPGTSTGAFTALSPLQPITATPYALQSLNAATATNANTAANFSGALGGDVTGTQGATTVSKLQGRAVANTAPLSGQVLKFNSTTNQWEPDTDNISGGGGGGTITGVTAGTGLSGGGASGNVTLNLANSGVGTTQLADNGVTDSKINSVSGSKVTGAVANATNAVNATNATNANTATSATNATTAVNFSGALGGDVTGNQSATTVEKLRNVSLPAPVLADHGKVLKYKNNGVDPISFEWAADNISAGGGVTSVTASGPLASSGGATPNLSLTGVVAAANGGTGLSAVGATGNLLRSNGAAWTSAALQASDVPDLGLSYIKNTTSQQAGSNFNISGTGTVGGTLTAGTLSGNGASLTNLNATNISSGTLSNARLGVIPLANGGTGLSTGPTAAGQFLRSSGAGVWAVGGIQASDLPALAYVAKAGDAMTGTLNLPANGLLAGGNQLALVGGNVGIGTANPVSKLHIQSGASDSAPQLQSSGTTSFAAGWDIYHGATPKGYVGVPDASASVGPGEMLLYGSPGVKTSLWAGGVRSVTIATNGYVGIGTDSDLYRLSVDGGSNPAIIGRSTNNSGVRGVSTNGVGVVGVSSVSGLNGAGVYGYGLSSGGIGVIGEAGSGTGTGVYGFSESPSGYGMVGRNVFGGYAGYFDGKVRVIGALEKPGGGFKIDHPLDPENKYLVHSFVESPDMKNLYDGTVTTDAQGEAEISLPDWFAALNRDFRYQLTCIGVFAQAIIAEKIKDNRFKIKTSLPNVEVSWQVTGTRQDAWANKNRLPVEEAKPAVERGFYQNPDAFGQPEERSIEWALRPAQMKEAKERREKAAREQADKTAAPAARPNQP